MTNQILPEDWMWFLIVGPFSNKKKNQQLGHNFIERQYISYMLFTFLTLNRLKFYINRQLMCNDKICGIN